MGNLEIRRTGILAVFTAALEIILGFPDMHRNDENQFNFK